MIEKYSNSDEILCFHVWMFYSCCSCFILFLSLSLSVCLCDWRATHRTRTHVIFNVYFVNGFNCNDGSSMDGKEGILIIMKCSTLIHAHSSAVTLCDLHFFSPVHLLVRASSLDYHSIPCATIMHRWRHAYSIYIARLKKRALILCRCLCLPFAALHDEQQKMITEAMKKFDKEVYRQHQRK